MSNVGGSRFSRWIIVDVNGSVENSHDVLYYSAQFFKIEQLKQVSKATFGERELVTVCGAINAIRNYLPPFIIFSRENWQQLMVDGEPPGTEGAPHPSGWMTGPNFLLFLNFFHKHVRCTKDSPCLIIFDSYKSHITIDSILLLR